MIIERHYDDEALIALMESDRDRADAHLPSCGDCSTRLESFRLIAEAMRDEDVWDRRPLRTDPVPETIATLRAFADRMTADDAEADAILDELLAGPREEWLPRLQARPEWRTAGVVRKLIAAASRAVDTMPPDAVEMTALATEIADHLDPGAHGPDLIARLRGTALRERAYALFYTGDFTNAEHAIDKADACLARCVVDEYDRARVALVRALIARAFERTSDALAACAASADVFARAQDHGRYATALFVEGHVHLKNRDYAEALRIFRRLEKVPELDENNRARLYSNLGFCFKELGDATAAVHYYTLASHSYNDIGVATEAARVRWGIADLLFANGRVDEAFERLSAAATELESLGMHASAALAQLSIAEILLVRHAYAEVTAMCRALIETFEASGLAYSTRALTALALLKEASANARATPQLARSVREYLRRLPAEPQLLFAMLPE